MKLTRPRTRLALLSTPSPQSRDILLVVDDVWDPAHLEPFLQGGPHCARLLTTRNLDTLPQLCLNVKVDLMQSNEAASLLGADLPKECENQITSLAKRVGNWPLLLGIVNGVLRERVILMHQPLPEAITYVNKALDKRGLTAFSTGNTQARNRAVELTVDVSLERFTQERRERFQELSIFPEDVAISLNVIATLWQVTGGLDDFEVEDFCGRLHSRSLLQSLDLAARQVRLHDVMRSYLQTELARYCDPKLVHGKLVDAWGNPHKLSEMYAWQWYAYHLAGADRKAELRASLLDPVWLQAKLAVTDISSLTADFNRLADDEDLELVHGAIRLSSSAIIRDPAQFASQMVGRLLSYEGMRAIDEFTKRVAECVRTPWLRSLQATLYPPGTALVRVLVGHTFLVCAVAVTSDGRRAISGSEDQTLKVWDLASGRELHTLTGHTDVVRAVAVTPDHRTHELGHGSGSDAGW